MELGTLQVKAMAFVHDILEAILFEHLVVIGHLVYFQDVAQTRAAAALHADAHELPLGQALGVLDATHLLDGAVGEADRGAGIVKCEDVGHGCVDIMLNNTRLGSVQMGKYTENREQARTSTHEH